MHGVAGAESSRRVGPMGTAIGGSSARATCGGMTRLIHVCDRCCRRVGGVGGGVAQSSASHRSSGLTSFSWWGWPGVVPRA